MRPLTALTALLLVGACKGPLIDDSAVAMLDGMRVRPRSPGNTLVEIRVGARSAIVGVTVYERVSTLEGLRADQRNVAVPVRLTSGEQCRWRLAPGEYLPAILPDQSGRERLRLAIVGANCVIGGWIAGYVCVVRGDASAIADNPWKAEPAEALTGAVALRRLRDDAEAPERPRARSATSRP